MPGRGQQAGSKKTEPGGADPIYPSPTLTLHVRRLNLVLLSELRPGLICTCFTLHGCVLTLAYASQVRKLIPALLELRPAYLNCRFGAATGGCELVSPHRPL